MNIHRQAQHLLYDLWCAVNVEHMTNDQIVQAWRLQGFSAHSVFIHALLELVKDKTLPLGMKEITRAIELGNEAKQSFVIICPYNMG